MVQVSIMADWQALGEVQYRKWSLYEEMLWSSQDLNIEDYKIFGSEFGGPLALTTSTSSSSSSGSVKEKLLIFTAAGRRISEIDLDNKCKSVGIGWSDQEQLIVVLEDGNVLIYDTIGKLIKSFMLLEITSVHKIVECVFWGDGVVSVATDLQLYIADGLSSYDLSSLRKYPMATSLSLKRPYTAIEVIPPLLSRSGMLEVILATVDGRYIFF